MSSIPFRRSSKVSRGGAALLIVLFLIILLTGLTIAFLSRSMTAVKVSSSSAGETKVGLLANSAGDIIIGDLKQEIIAGSTSTTYNSTNVVYTPKSNLAMIPWQNGIPSATTNSIPNLISRSVRPGNTTGLSPYIPFTNTIYTSSAIPPNRAADDTGTPTKVSSSTPSLNGRYISPALWNSHYLIPRSTSITAGSTNTDSTPVSSFVAPDWVVVTRSGANSVIWNSTLTDSSLNNTNYVVGRYAYAVYNEGGLLDMNAAGFPADPSSPGGTNGLTYAQSGRKGPLSLADLTQLTAGTTSMTQAQVNNIVGWRNYASANMSAANGNYGNFNFTSSNATNWLNNVVLNNTNGFMKVVTPTGYSGTQTDQAFLSRQQLISMSQSLAISPDFLQYLGTFSRAIEQPSYSPDANRPRIINSGSALPSATTADSYVGNNDGKGGDDVINPAFLSQRVTGNFNRYDPNNTPAVIGEPLVKTKFPLSRLALVTYSATATTSDPIYKYFGLTRSSNSSPWTYNHGNATSIMTLSAVAAANREPDFAELLKAAITAGSLAKGGPNLNKNSGQVINYQFVIDTTVDYQVLQIMANLIDQQDADSYPTVIQISAGTYNRTFCGVEDLPYFYRYHLFSVVDSLPSTPLASTDKVTFPIVSGTRNGANLSGKKIATGATASASWTVNNAAAVTIPHAKKISSTLDITPIGTAAGEVTYFYVPEVWNPHDPNTVASTTSANRPTQFRMYMTTQDPAAQTVAWSIAAESRPNNYGNAANKAVIPESTSSSTIYNWPISSPVTYSSNGNPTAYLTFSDNAGALFREPTLLWYNNPNNSINLGGTGDSVVDAVNTSPARTYYGLIAGKAPLQMKVLISTTPTNAAVDGTYLIQGETLTTVTTLPTGSYQQLAFWLQYKDANNNWVTYDVKYPDMHGMVDPNIVANTADYSNSSYMNPLSNTQLSDHVSGFDPRTARWGVGTQSHVGEVSSGTLGNSGSNVTWVLEPTAYNNFSTGTSAGNTAMGTSNFSVLETQRARADKGNQVNYSNPGMTSDPGQNVLMRLFSGIGFGASNGKNTSPVEFDGLLSQNNPLELFNSRDNSTPNQQMYFEDADGVCRRAMGAYADTTMTDSSTDSRAQASVTTTPNRIGLPLATASTVDNNAIATATQQSQSRPLILNRAFRSVAEMSYAFSGTPWKNIDFFTPESGDVALLDVFCLNELPPTGIIAGRVDLNTRQTPVIKALVGNASRDEVYASSSTPPSYALPPLSSAEATQVAAKLTAITSDTADAWRGPLKNVSELVGRYVASPGSPTAGTIGTDWYTYVPPNPVSGQTASATYAGFSAALGTSSADTVYTNSTNNAAISTYRIQRMRESAIRPLVDAGQVRVWNLLIDIVAQTGRYPKTATGLDQFLVEGQKRVWLHVAIDRFTGQILDKQVEVVNP